MTQIHKRLCLFLWLGLIGSAAADTPASGTGVDMIEQILAASVQATHQRQPQNAVRILQRGLAKFSDNNQLQLELGRTYLSTGESGRAIRQFRSVLSRDPNDRAARLELARALGFRQDYRTSSEIYRQLLTEDPADEAASIGLASNLLHEKRREDARDIVEHALSLHSDSLRLQEYKDRIDDGKLGGEELEVEAPSRSVNAYADYYHDSGGDHYWRAGQSMDFGIRSGLFARVESEQNLTYLAAHTFEAADTASGSLEWHPHERLLVSGGAGAVRFNDRDLQPTFESSIEVQALRSLVLGGGFSRAPILANAETTEHKVIAQGWDASARWVGPDWHLSVIGSRDHYSDRNLGARETVEATRAWRVHALSFETGYRYQHYGFDTDPGDGYFSPDDYQSHLAVGRVIFRSGKTYRGEFLARCGTESIGDKKPFSPAWEIITRNQLEFRRWTLDVDYSKYRLTQQTGAFSSESGRIGIAYHF